MKYKLLTALLLITASMAPWSKADAAVIGFNSVVNGTNLDVTVAVSDLGPEIVSAYDVDVTFNAALIQFLSLDFGTMLGGPADSLQASGSAGGIVDAAEVSFLTDDELATLQGGGPVSLFTIHFRIEDESADYGLGFIWDQFNDVKGRRNQIIIPTGEVPEPSTLALLGLGLLGVGFARRLKAF